MEPNLNATQSANDASNNTQPWLHEVVEKNKGVTPSVNPTLSPQDFELLREFIRN